MGGAQSARRISIDNDNPSTVIKVSEKVVDRLKIKNTNHYERPSPYPTSHKKPGQYEAHREAKDELDKEVKKNNEFWENRIKEMRHTQNEMKKKMKLEYDRTVKEMEDVLPKKQKEKGSPPCKDLEKNVVSCYKSNSEQPLKCADVVAEFSNCLANTRVQKKEQKTC